jgi:hypothetical protein
MAQPFGPEGFIDPLNAAIGAIREGVTAAVRAYNGLVDKVRDVAWLLGPAATYWIKTKLDAVRAALRLLVDKARYAADHQAPVVSLMTTSFGWVDRVKTPVSGLSFRVTEPANEELAKWTGDAQRSYQSKAVAQRAAVDETVAKAEFISQWLFTIAKANVEYAVELAKIVTAFAGHCVDALIEAAGVVTIPWAVDTLGDAAGMLVEKGMNNLATVGQRFVDALGNVRDLGGQVGDHSRLPSGGWPQAVRG